VAVIRYVPLTKAPDVLVTAPVTPSIPKTAVEPPGADVKASVQHNSWVSLRVSAEPFFPVKVPKLVDKVVKPVVVAPHAIAPSVTLVNPKPVGDTLFRVKVIIFDKVSV